MSIKVLFDKNGWQHPSFGRLGTGKREGEVYILPDYFGEREVIEVDVMDISSRPPRKIGTKEITRYKHLPQSVTILTDADVAAKQAEADEGDEQAREMVDAIKAAKAPKNANPEALARTNKASKPIAGAGSPVPAQDAQERTTGRARRTRFAPAEE